MTPEDEKDTGLGTRSHNGSHTSSDTEIDNSKLEVSSTSNDSISIRSEKDNQETYFEPIQTSPTARAPTPTARRPSKDTLRTASLRRERSNNGYGVDELDIDASLGPPGGQQQPGNIEKTGLSAPDEEVGGGSGSLEDDQVDPFEVVWEGGDDDPMNPRSMPKWRKWVIVGITSFGSLCV